MAFYLWLGWPPWNICVTNDHGCLPLVVSISRSFLHSRLVTRLIRPVPLVEQALVTLPKHLSSTPVSSGVCATRSLGCFCMFCRSLFVLCTFSFGHCVVCSSLIYGFLLPLWYLQTLLIHICINIRVAIILTQTLIEITYPAGQSFI
jgi:hypothetical protein